MAQGQSSDEEDRLGGKNPLASEPASARRDPQIDLALRLLAEKHGLPFRYLGRYGPREFGAHRVDDGAGQGFCLKIAAEWRLQRGATTSGALRRLGYPAPEYLIVDALAGDRGYALQCELPGSPPADGDVSFALTDELLALNELQAGQALLVNREPPVVQTLLSGGNGFALHEPLLQHSAETSALLDAIVSIGKKFADLDYPTHDVVHYDFHLRNMLVDEGHITGVVDWEGTASGDRAFDIATFLFYAGGCSAAVQDRLWQTLLELTGWQRTSVYLAHMMLRQVDWSIRFHDAATLRSYVQRSFALLSKLHRLD